MSDRGRSMSQEREETRFSGYGDHVGGIELAPSQWKGGEAVTDPTYIQKYTSVKPKRFFYSPIGDGVVAADGVEMKRGPPDLTPRVTVIQERIVEKGAPSQAGRRVVEKVWTSGGGGDDANAASALTGAGLGGGGLGDGGAQPRAAAAPVAPSQLDSLADSLKNLVPRNSPQTTAPPPPRPVAPPVQPSTGFGNLGDFAPTPPPKPAFDPYAYASRDATPKTTDPYGSLGSTKSNLYENRIKSPSNGFGDMGGLGDYPGSGRTSTTSALLSDPGMRYEMKKDYLVTNPRELIHQYATTTPINSIPGYEILPGGGQVTQTIKQNYSQVVEESFGPYPPYTAHGGSVVNPNKFVRQLRDQTMTSSQRQANMNTQALGGGNLDYNRINEVRQQSHRVSPIPEVDSLTNRLVTGLETGQPPRL